MPQGSDEEPKRPLHLRYMYLANGTHPAEWRYPGAESADRRDRGAP